ncbi:MAG: peptidoglycan binding domain-containing protein [Lachnospiraceae bacterium]|nr:peptidoglycan binding domain-containing protein [Lachnospiraceae bacterium]
MGSNEGQDLGKNIEAQLEDLLGVPLEPQAEKKPETKEPEPEPPKKEKKSKKTKKGKKWKIAGIIAGVILLVGICVYGGFAYYYHDKFFQGTIINGTDCTELTVAQAEDFIRGEVEKYSIQLTFRDDASEEITGESIDYAYVSDGSVAKIKKEQNVFLWIKGLFTTEEHQVAKGISFDEALLKEKMNSLTHLQSDNQITPEDAYVDFVDGSFQVVPEVVGSKLNSDTLFDHLKEAVANSQTTIAVPDTGAYIGPGVLSDSADLAKECEQLNYYAKATITYELPQGDQILDGNEIKTWLTRTEAGDYTISEEVLTQHVTDYVKKIAEDTDTVGKERTFHATLNGDITVSGGSYGWKVNRKTEIAQLKDDILNNRTVSRAPAYTSEEVTKKDDNSGFGDTYVEIDLGNQHMWYYIDGKLYVESDLVSGTATKADRKTPGGIFRLTYKQRDKVLQGRLTADGVPEYQSPVSYWMPFNGGIGMHDASWRGSFGGTIYKYSGSHGCINLPAKKAAAIYEKIDKQTPIILYY